MWNHVGGHILCGLQGVEDTKIGNFWKQKTEGRILKDEKHPKILGENPCGFCGKDEWMQYKHAATSSSTTPCTNVPIHCPLCPTSVSGNHHLITEHSNSGILPEIPGELLVKMFIHQKVEQALGIGEDFTYGWRRENIIPDSYESLNDNLRLVLLTWVSKRFWYP